jgi:hypothetical protein
MCADLCKVLLFMCYCNQNWEISRNVREYTQYQCEIKQFRWQSALFYAERRKKRGHGEANSHLSQLLRERGQKKIQLFGFKRRH